MINIAIVSFPGSNCEVESARAIQNAGMNPVFLRWNNTEIDTNTIDGYFIIGGFSYEDRGRAGMIAARDPLMDRIRQEANDGKVVIGNCNGAQILVESGLIPNGEHLDMSLARNSVNGEHTGYLHEWVWITPTVEKDRCATSNWNGSMQMPIAHGEGRYTTKDKDLFDHLRQTKQIAFCYADEHGNTSKQLAPNGSEFAIAGICNYEGNVIALMPHPERTPDGAPYFASIKTWIEQKRVYQNDIQMTYKCNTDQNISTEAQQDTEVFIDTLIVNNEERSVEQALRKTLPKATLKQMKYFSVQTPSQVLSSISLFNPNKEKAYIRRGDSWTVWDDAQKEERQVDSIFSKVTLLRKDEPLDTELHSGVCYILDGVDEKEVQHQEVREVLSNPHSSVLSVLQ